MTSIQMPQLGWILGMCAMASLGLPGLAGFWGEFPAILAAYSPNFGLDESLYRTLMVIAAVGTVFAAAYLLWLALAMARTAAATASWSRLTDTWPSHASRTVASRPP